MRLALDPGCEQAVRDWIEGVLGWQVCDAGDESVPPVLVLADHTASGGDRRSRSARRGSLPCILVVVDGADVREVAVAAGALAPEAVVAWPAERDRLPRIAAAALARTADPELSRPTLRVGGSAGGVGTSTVGLALGGLRAWSGRRTLVAVRGRGHAWRDLPAPALGGHDLWRAADPVAGVDGLRAVRLVGTEPVPSCTDPDIDAAVVDVGVDTECEILVCRPDRAGLQGLQETTAAAVVLLGPGSVPRRAVFTALAGRRCVHLPLSSRVARAGAQGRVPAGLPGSWLQALAPVLHSRAPSTGAGSPGPEVRS